MSYRNMPVPKPRNDYKYSYADYLSWPDQERWEIIEGVPYPFDFGSEFSEKEDKLLYNMSPSPGSRHQKISGELFAAIHTVLKGKRCNVFTAPLDVRLYEDNVDSDEVVYTVVQPDIVVICDKSKIDEKGCKGAPDICIEILSPSTAYKDETEKFKLYEKYGVREYWIVHPELERITVYTLKDGEYGNPEVYKKTNKLQSSVLEQIKMDLNQIFYD
jgi:Uma2 family endonuclease